MLMTRAGLVPGETVLIHGIGGGVALAALQLAKLAPDRIKSLILLGANARGRNFDSPNPIRQLLEASPEAMLARFEQFLPD